MTTETAAHPWDLPTSAAGSLVDTSPRDALGGASANRNAAEDVTRMVIAVGALLDWQGAFLVDHAVGADRRDTVVRTWALADEQEPSTDPGWLWLLQSESWEHRRIRWRPVNPREAQPCAYLAVPVRCDGDVRGALCFYGPRLRHPDDVAIGLLEAIAGILAHEFDRDRVNPDEAVGASAAERAIAMVDVFAYTVRVNPDGALQWRYFGPNSEAVFGEGVYPDEPLMTMVRRFAHEDDAELVAQFARALSEGTPLDVEFRVNGLDGVTRWISWRTVPRFTDGALHVDGVVTDVSARRSLDGVLGGVRPSEAGDELLRQQARLVRDANDNVLQRIFAAGLRLQILKRKLSDVEAHAVTAIAFQLDQAATDLREVIIDLTAVADGRDLAAS
jgi:PAS domain-containing protein